MFARLSGASIVAASCVIAAGVSAQTPTSDSLLFRPRQWGVFATMGGIGSAGLMRFSSPRRAFTFDASIAAGQSQRTTDTVEGEEKITDGQAVATVRLGVRNYRTRSREIVSFVGFGPRGIQS